jgi:phosphoglucosamine mutase
VLEGMEHTGAVLGGEQSGHIIFAETGVGDGIYTGLRVCEVLARTGEKVGERCAEVKQVPQVLLNVPVRDKHAWDRSRELKKALQEEDQRLGTRGRVLIRPSGTEPLVRVMVEAVEEGEAYAVAEALAEIVARELGYGEAAEGE